ncbi:MAG: OmpA family protein [Bacteroidota bacterium]|nr:OmpA family protein [Bacteroidota bacterium]
MQIWKMKYFLVLCGMLISGLLFADFDPETCSGTDNSKAEKQFKKAKELYYKNQNKAKEYLAKALKEDEYFADAYYMLADFAMQDYENARGINAKIEKQKKAEVHTYLMRILNICPKYENYNLNYLVGEEFFKDKDFIKAEAYLKVFVRNTKDNKKAVNIAQDMLDEIDLLRQFKRNPVPFNPEPVEGVSTKEDEYLPLISPDGELLFYTRQFMKEDINSIYGQRLTEEFTVANRADSTYMHYVDTRAMPDPFNQGNNQGGISITIDNSTLFVTQCIPLDDYQYRNCDIYISHRTAYGWSEMKNLGPNVNGKLTWESQPSISPDGKTLFFASVRPENLGSTKDYQSSDIYYTCLQEDDTWSKAQNMGKPINTEGNEKSPFFHADNRTLYFTSDGHDGLGGFDIFYSQQIDSAWIEPKNIGYPINTEEDDLGFVVSTNGDCAYFASNKLNGNGGYDIYGFRLYEEARPDKVLFVKGKLVNENGVAITDAKVEVQNATTREVTEGIMDDESGNYAVAMRIEEESDDDYLMVVKRENSSFTSRLLDPDEMEDNKPTEINVTVQPIETGQAVRLHDIYFDFASAKIQKKSFIVLDNFVDFLNENIKLTFEIHGHTDDVGNDQTNMRLSKERAKTVYNYLLKNGINASRMNYLGFGEERPIATNETNKGRAQNRRTEFFIVDN